MKQLQNCFMRCDKQRNGQCTKKSLLMKLAKYHVKLPEDLLENLLEDIALPVGK